MIYMSAQFSSFVAQSSVSFESFLEIYLKISPLFFVVGVFVLILSGMFSLTTPKTLKPKVVGTYNPAFDPKYKNKLSKNNSYQYISVGLIILGIVPWILNILILNPPV